MGVSGRAYRVHPSPPYDGGTPAGRGYRAGMRWFGVSHDVRKSAEWKALVVWAKTTMPWVCHLCDQPIPVDVVLPHPLSYSLDHIQPVRMRPDLALAPSNVAPSHHRCNSYRKARPLTPGLKLEIAERFTVRDAPALKFFG